MVKLFIHFIGLEGSRLLFTQIFHFDPRQSLTCVREGTRRGPAQIYQSFVFEVHPVGNSQYYRPFITQIGHFYPTIQRQRITCSQLFWVNTSHLK